MVKILALTHTLMPSLHFQGKFHIAYCLSIIYSLFYKLFQLDTKVEHSKSFSMKKHHKRFVPPRNDGLRCIGRDKKHPCPDVDFHSERMEVHIHTYKNEYNICITLYIHRIHH